MTNRTEESRKVVREYERRMAVEIKRLAKLRGPPRGDVDEPGIAYAVALQNCAGANMRISDELAAAPPIREAEREFPHIVTNWQQIPPGWKTVPSCITGCGNPSQMPLSEYCEECAREKDGPTVEPVAPDDLIARLKEADRRPCYVESWRDLVREAAAALSAAREDAAHALASSMDWREKEQHQHDRAEAAEADLARARQIIGDLTRDSPGCFCEPEHQFYCSHCKATAFLAEGDKGAKG